MKSIELIIFDLDGTLVDSQYDLGDAVNYALAELNREMIPQEKIPKLLGSGITKLLEFSMGTYSNEELTKAKKIFMDFYSQNYTQKTTFFPEVPNVLKHFSSLKKAVFSNKYHPFTVDILENLALDHHFELIQGILPDGIQPKPHPEGIHFILEQLQIKPANTLMVGDSTHDIEAGKRAGTYTCGVSYGYRPLSVLKNTTPDFLIDNLSELKNIIA